MIYLFYMPHEFALNAPLICKNNRPFCQKHFVEEVIVRTSNAKKWRLKTRSLYQPAAAGYYRKTRYYRKNLQLPILSWRNKIRGMAEIQVPQIFKKSNHPNYIYLVSFHNDWPFKVVHSLHRISLPTSNPRLLYRKQLVYTMKLLWEKSTLCFVCMSKVYP